jgi:hypothetical protein
MSNFPTFLSEIQTVKVKKSELEIWSLQNSSFH